VSGSDNQLWKRLQSKRTLSLISGPCVIESEALCMQVARTMKKTCDALGVHYIFKASYDKANRTSQGSFRGPGIDDGLATLERVKRKFDLPILTDVHNEEQAIRAAEVADILQIPAFLCRQTDLIEAAVSTGRVVNIKKGQFLSPEEMSRVVEKAASFGGKKLMLTERGTTFGYNNLVSDMRSIPIMKRTGFPVVFDATHSVQLPGGAGASSGGQREFAPLLATCAIAAGADALFVETHPKPDEALSDGPNMIPLSQMPKFLKQILKVRAAVA
jgi:2-dehydro-3-deoxyphosphooctonate aldolase (KDO 8-P synthase)